MSTSASQTVAQFLTGKPMKKITKNFCPVSTWDIPDGFVSGFQYYRNVFTTSYSGKYANNSAWLFELEPKYPKSKTQNMRAVILPVWTDFRNYLLMISCWQDGKSDWILYSKRKLLDQYTHKFILSKVSSIGFDTNDVYINKYTHCTDWRTEMARREPVTKYISFDACCYTTINKSYTRLCTSDSILFPPFWFNLYTSSTLVLCNLTCNSLVLSEWEY